MAAVHYMNPGDTYGWQHTACGIECMPSRVSGEYETALGNRIEARYRNWHGITCKRCLRNCAAPGGRIDQALAQNTG